MLVLDLLQSLIKIMHDCSKEAEGMRDCPDGETGGREAPSALSSIANLGAVNGCSEPASQDPVD